MARYQEFHIGRASTSQLSAVVNAAGTSRLLHTMSRHHKDAGNNARHYEFSDAYAQSAKTTRAVTSSYATPVTGMFETKASNREKRNIS
jgi:hypothetical protein